MVMNSELVAKIVNGNSDGARKIGLVTKIRTRYVKHDGARKSGQVDNLTQS